MRIPAALLCLLIAACPALAQDKSKDKKPPPPPKMTEEQKLQALKTSCNKEADELKLKSNARNSFLAGCAGEPAPQTDDKSKKAGEPAPKADDKAKK